MGWKDSLKRDSADLEEFLVFLQGLKEQAQAMEHQAPTWERVLEARGRVKQMEDLISQVMAEEREARVYEDFRSRNR